MPDQMAEWDAAWSGFPVRTMSSQEGSPWTITAQRIAAWRISQVGPALARCRLRLQTSGAASARHRRRAGKTRSRSMYVGPLRRPGREGAPSQIAFAALAAKRTGGARPILPVPARWVTASRSRLRMSSSSVIPLSHVVRRSRANKLEAISRAVNQRGMRSARGG
jgi:hypothetical protein